MPRRVKNQTVSSLDAFTLGAIYLVTALKDCEAAKGNIKGGFLSGQKQTKAKAICFCKNANTAHITEIGGTFIVILVS